MPVRFSSRYFDNFLEQSVGYPLAVHFTEKVPSTQGGFNVGGINASGQVPSLPGNFGLIDKDTPSEAYTYKSYHDESEMVLVFSDEFNQDDRSFYPGDDPFWEGVDLHYWGTVSRFVVPKGGLYILCRTTWNGMTRFKVANNVLPRKFPDTIWCSDDKGRISSA